jgi:hypothetical protein
METFIETYRGIDIFAVEGGFTEGTWLFDTVEEVKGAIDDDAAGDLWDTYLTPYGGELYL